MPFTRFRSYSGCLTTENHPECILSLSKGAEFHNGRTLSLRPIYLLRVGMLGGAVLGEGALAPPGQAPDGFGGMNSKFDVK